MTTERTFNIFIPGIGYVLTGADNPLPRHYRPLRGAMDERQKFWQAKDWPDDVRDKVFLARAVHQLGSALFGDEWTGHEPTVDYLLRPLPMFSYGLRPWEVTQATQYLDPNEPADMSGDWAKKVKAMWQPRWDAAVALRLEVLAAIEGPRARLAAVTSTLRLAMRDGDLKYFVLISETGKFQGPLDPDWWNTKLHSARFYRCAMNPGTPITPAIGGGGFSPIFVDADDLAGIVAAAAPNATSKTKAGKPHPNSPWTPAERAAARGCAKWWWETYISKSQTPTHTKAELKAEARKQPFFSEMRDSQRAFDRAFADAVAMGNGAFDAWLLGDAAKE